MAAESRSMKLSFTSQVTGWIALLVVALLLSLAPAVRAQDAVPMEMLKRTLCIRNGSQQGTGFAVDYKGKVYLVTARHVATGVPKENAIIQVRQSGKWLDLQTIKTFFPSSKDVDIAIFEVDTKLPSPYSIKMAESGGVTMGQQVWFLGYPWGVGSSFKNGESAPFIKGGKMSAIDSSNPDAIVLYIDGFNNPGFSGGPIVYWSFEQS